MDKKNKIIVAAISEFAKNGFEKASMDAVALKAKVAKGTIFYHFKSSSCNCIKTIIYKTRI
jgi:AcrR family transcriptional regulator